LHPRSLGAGVAIGEVDQAGKLAVELDVKLSFVRHQTNLLDQLPEALGGLRELIAAFATALILPLHSPGPKISQK
jgi:hypothetical protein